MSRTDLDYFTHRERAERDQAERTQDSSARHAHLAMANRYAERLKLMSETSAIPLR